MAVSGSMPFLLPSPCVTGSALSFSLAGQHVGAANFTLCTGCCFASLSRGVPTLRHNQSPDCIGCLLSGVLILTGTGLSPVEDDDFPGHTTLCWLAFKKEG